MSQRQQLQFEVVAYTSDQLAINQSFQQLPSTQDANFMSKLSVYMTNSYKLELFMASLGLINLLELLTDSEKHFTY